MVMKPEPIFKAVEAVRCEPASGCRERVILLCPQGRLLTHEVARELASADHLVFVCGHYEGVDERVREHLVTDEISIGDYVLTGGELAALVVLDAVARWVPGVLGAEESAESDSFASGLLEYPQYTRPSSFRGWPVPEVLLSGHHEQVRRWRRKEALRRSLLRRQDLLDRAPLTEEDRRLLEEIGEEQAEAEPTTQ
jgi:tRNA (guanine37-N1)-methyltransferase